MTRAPCRIDLWIQEGRMRHVTSVIMVGEAWALRWWDRVLETSHITGTPLYRLGRLP